MTLRDALQSELAAAMQRRDRPVATTLRTVLSQLANAEAVPIASGTTHADHGWTVSSEHVAGAARGLGATEAQRASLSDDQVRAIVTGERTELLAHAERLARMCRRDEADGVRRAAAVLAGLLAPEPTADPRG